MIDQRIEKWLMLQQTIFILIIIATFFIQIPLLNWIRGLGAFLFIIGLMISFIAFIQLGSSFTPFVKPVEQGKLQTTGIYQYVRHPMYSAISMIALGWSFFWGSLLSILLTLIYLFVVDRKASEEEKWLTKKYPEYENYRTRVKKFIPFIY